jgi:peptidoglycan L-alanyl-D-glutamate endopeptidase CwlK
MSAPIFAADVLSSQRLYSCAGFYAGKLDGVWGPKTDAAADAWEQDFRGRRDRFDEQHQRTEGALRTVLPAAQELLRRLLETAEAAGIGVRVISGTRSYLEQDRLYAQGRTLPGLRVTNAKGGQSLHNFGLAGDVGIFAAGAYLPESPLYGKLGLLFKERLGSIGEWGGDWSKPDRPHYQVRTGLGLAELRRRFERGTLRLPIVVPAAA